MTHLVAPSILAANFLHLERDILMINESNADWLHVDIMDGCFVPNISFGPAIVKAIYSACQIPLDVHLMINDPSRYLLAFKEAGASVLTVHLEVCNNLHRVIQEIKALGCQVGVAVNPHTPVSLLEDVLGDIDMVLIMSVNPGFGGQKFIPHTLNKIRTLRKQIEEQGLSTRIEIDGGVGLDNAQAIIEAGADVLVAGSSVFKSKDPIQSIQLLKNIRV